MGVVESRESKVERSHPRRVSIFAIDSRPLTLDV
jgi:hypothetical protein